MAELSRGDVAIAILVEVTQALDEVICGVDWALTGDGLHDGQEHLEADALIWSVLVRELLDLGLGGVLAQGSQDLPDLRHLDLAITLLVEDGEGLLEFYDLILAECC